MLKKWIIAGLTSFVLASCTSKVSQMNTEFDQFVARYDSTVAPLVKQINLAYWNASLTGKPDDFKKTEELQLKLLEILSNKSDFELLKRLKESQKITDSIKSRTLEVLYLTYLSNQSNVEIQKQIIAQQSLIEQKYANFRPNINGATLSDNDIENILLTETNSQKLQNAWTAHKQIGPLVADDIRKLVKLRNQSARELGFTNYHEMSLSLSEQDPKQVESLFNELDSLTSQTFTKLKTDIDKYLAERYKIKPEELKPWHYQNRFFQEAPKIYKVDLDNYYKNTDLSKLTSTFYESIGLPIDDLLANSDLYEKPGKNQHAYCIDIDNKGDVRVLCNIKPNSYWMNTMLHEYGHAAFDKYISRDLPFALSEPAHTFATEAVAMIFGRLSSNPQWLKEVVGISEEEKAKIADDCFNNLRLEQLVFSRWAQVMYRFEQSMYANPDQDLNALWWSLVEKYQGIKRPEGRNEPDWATKIHVALYPCYYHNYLMGELLASQMHYYITSNIIKSDDMRGQSYYKNKEIGEFFKTRIFEPGKRYPWNEMIEKATGEKLTAKYYAKEFTK